MQQELDVQTGEELLTIGRTGESFWRRPKPTVGCSATEGGGRGGIALLVLNLGNRWSDWSPSAPSVLVQGNSLLRVGGCAVSRFGLNTLEEREANNCSSDLKPVAKSPYLLSYHIRSFQHVYLTDWMKEIRWQSLNLCVEFIWFSARSSVRILAIRVWKLRVL